ncbi:MAG TPA: nitroreductase family protein [Opitutaceae bacterium]|nr:nitroreductase family protein [Opitutaceae bacterium]
MELMDAIYQRRAVRHFTDQAIPKATLMTLLRAATQAPSAVNQQPWAFAVIRGRERLERYSERARHHMLAALPHSLALHRRSDALTGAHTNVFHHANTLVVIYAKPPQHDYHPTEDCCLAAENLMLAACDLGLGSCPVGFVRPWLDLDDIKYELGIPVNYTAVMPIVLGWPAEPVAPTPRDPPEIVCWAENSAEIAAGETAS